MRRLLLAVLVLAGAFATPTPSIAASTCSQILPIVTGGQRNPDLVATTWNTTCNSAYNLTVVLQYVGGDGLWHNATCQNGVVCRRDKPNDGSWFSAGESRGGGDQWLITTPVEACTRRFRERINIHFKSGAGGITLNGDSVLIGGSGC